MTVVSVRSLQLSGVLSQEPLSALQLQSSLLGHPGDSPQWSHQGNRKRPAPEDSPCTPSTPVAHEPTSVADPRVVHWLSSIYTGLQRGLDQLHSLHPACKLIPTESAELALGIFRQYAAVTGLSYQYAVMQPLVLHAVVGVCLWSAIKFLATPGVVPNSRFMATAIGVPSSLLLSFEPEVLRAVSWDLLAICKAIGLAPCEPMDDLE